MEPTAEPDPHMPETSKRKWNRPRIAAWAGAIVLSICIPVAIDQAYFRYNAYILPIVGLLVVLVYGGLIVTMHGISTKIHTFHQGFGIAHPWKYILTISVCGGIVILLLVSGEWYAVQKSKDHVATLRKHDSGARGLETTKFRTEQVQVPALPPAGSERHVGKAAQQSKPTLRHNESQHEKNDYGSVPAVGSNSGVVGQVTQGPCSNLQVGGSNNEATTNCAPVPFRHLTDSQKQGIKTFVDSLPASLMVTIGSVIGSGDGNSYAVEFFPLFDGHHLENETAPRLRTGFTAVFTGVFVATVSDSEPATRYRDALVDALVSVGIPAHKANGSKVPGGNLELLIAFRPEEVKPQ